MFELSRDPELAEQQVQALAFCLVAFAFVDGDLDPSEAEFIRGELAGLARQRAAHTSAPGGAAPFLERHRAHLDRFVEHVRAHFTESVAEGETATAYVASRLKLGCLELLGRLDDDLQAAIVEAVEALVHADGRVHPSEAAFLAEVKALLAAPEVELDDADLEEMVRAEVRIGACCALPEPVEQDHPVLRHGEWDFSLEPLEFSGQSERDIALVARVEETLRALRSRGQGALARGTTLDAQPPGPRVLDGRVFLQRPMPKRDYELLVLGDLHGCYSCMKAALLQADFFGKVQRHEEAPDAHPEVALVLLGDYIDRGRFGYTGTLRAALELFTRFPRNVVLLRGNHEYYVELSGRVLAPVRPCEAIDSLAGVDGSRLLRSYRRLFDDLPTSFVFGETIFVHGGIPRDATFEAKWQGLRTLNDPEFAFEMLWSDPGQVDAVPRDLQKEVARFGFGRRQFQRFMKAAGLRLMVRGHERVKEGFRVTYDDADAKLVTLFSAGGADNADLPARSNYREVTPMALRLLHRDGVTDLAPFAIDYARFNDAERNAFFAGAIAGVARS